MPDGSSRDSRPSFASLIAQHCTDSILFTDPDGRTVWANLPFTEMTGYGAGEMIGQKPGALLQGPDTDPATRAEIAAALAERRRVRTEILNYHKSGRPYWIDLTITPIFDGDGRLTHFMSIERDVTDRRDLIRQTEAALRLETDRRRERRLLAQMSEWLFSAQDMAELQAVVTLAMERLFPGTDGVLYIFSNSRDVLDWTSHWGLPRAAEHLRPNECWALRRGRAYAFGTGEIDFPCTHVDGHGHPTLCLPVVAHGDTIGLLTVVMCGHRIREGDPDALRAGLSHQWELALIAAEQISLAAANVRLQAELQDRSVRDPLTGLWNRRWFLDMAAREIGRAEGAGRPLSLATLDIDRFKEVNDRHGHDAGDTVLRLVGRELTETVPADLFACRLGGEEFALICPGYDLAAACATVDLVRARIGGLQIPYAGGLLPAVTCSAGVARLRPGDSVTALLRRSDAALYRAKAAGRNCTLPDPQDGEAPTLVVDHRS